MMYSPFHRNKIRYKKIRLHSILVLDKLREELILDKGCFKIKEWASVKFSL